MVRVARVIELRAPRVFSRVRNHIFQYEIQRSEFYTVAQNHKKSDFTEKIMKTRTPGK